MRVFCDIDGTLTTKQARWQPVIQSRVDKVKQLVADGHEVVVWSGSTRYARRWCRKHGIKGVIAIGKPTHIVDNQARIRPGRKMTITPPEWLDGDCA